MHLSTINLITKDRCYRCLFHHHILFLIHHILLRIVLPIHQLNQLPLDLTVKVVQILPLLAHLLDSCNQIIPILLTHPLVVVNISLIPLPLIEVSNIHVQKSPSSCY